MVVPQRNPQPRMAVLHQNPTPYFGEYPPDFFKDEDELRRIWSVPETLKKLTPPLRLKYGGPWEAVAELGKPEEIRQVFCGVPEVFV